MMLAARARPSRIKGMIGLAAAPDFGDNLYKNLSAKNKREIKNKGIIKYSSFGFSYFIRKIFFIDARKNKVLDISNTDFYVNSIQHFIEKDYM